MFADRYFPVAMKTRRQVWRTLRYALSNGRKHGAWLQKGQPDPFSSGRRFRRRFGSDHIRRPVRSAPVARAPVLELLFLGPIHVDDVLGPRWPLAVWE